MKALSDGGLPGSDAQTYTNGAASGALSPVMTKETQARETDMKPTQVRVTQTKGSSEPYGVCQTDE